MTQKTTYLRTSLGLIAVFSLLLGGAYPLVVLAIGQAAFPHQANGSLIEKDGKVIGSHLLGQQFDKPEYFWSRPSATSPAYNASASSGSNLSPGNPKLLNAANERLESLQKADPHNKEKIPVDLLTSSASGLDPEISYAGARYQVERVAKARHKKPEDILALIDQHKAGGVLGAKRVNVLELNLALDELK